jgi:hypothetical protein
MRCAEGLVAGGWWLVAGGWWLVASGWWLVAGTGFTPQSTCISLKKPDRTDFRAAYRGQQELRRPFLS